MSAVPETKTACPSPARPKAVVLYDGQCRLCQKSVRLLQRLDWFHRLAYQDARAETNWPVTEPPLQFEQLMSEMHVVTPRGRVHRGFMAFRWIAWRLPLVAFVAPLLYVPGVPALGRRVYRWVARNRFGLVPCDQGECRLPPTAR